MKKKLALLMLLPFGLGLNTQAQIGNADCNTQSPWTSSTFTNLTASVTDNVGSLVPLCLGNASNVSRLTDADLNNFSQIDITGIGCNATLSVKDTDAADTYPAGTWAGFNIGTGGLLPGSSIAASVTITTYNNGTLQETYDAGAALATLDPGLFIGSRTNVGFTTTLPFDEVRITYQSLISLLFTGKVYYAVINKQCEGETPSCNEPTALVSPDYSVSIDDAGVTGLTLGSVNNAEQVINSDMSDGATITLPASILASGFVSVKDNLKEYPAGYYAGFEVSNTTFLGLSLLQYTTVSTYLNNELQESKTYNSLIISAPILAETGRQMLGFQTTAPFDEVRFTVNQPLGLELGVTEVHAAIVRQFCEGPELECNTLTTVHAPTYPVFVNTERTGVNGVACLGCTLNESDNVINNVADDYSELIMFSTIGTNGNFSVKDGFTTYPAGTFAAFDIANINIINSSFLGATTIRLYNNGELVQTSTGSAQILNLNSSFVTGFNRGLVGTVANVPFDEVRISFINTASISFGTTRIYDMVLLKGCAGNFECTTSTTLTLPDYPVVIEGDRTGVFSGLACSGCEVSDAWNVVNSNPDDYARINLVSGVLGTTGAISVRDLTTEYPAGTVAGFIVSDPNPILELGFLNAISITTYLNGVPKETFSGDGSLIDFNLILPWLGGGSGKRTLGFEATEPFNEMKIAYTLLGGSLLTFLDVHSVFVDGRSTTGGSTPAYYCCPNKPPVFSTDSIATFCPQYTVNLDSVHIGITPNGSDLVWYDGADPATANAVTNSTQVTGSGTYYAFYHNTTDGNDCYSPASVPLIVDMESCIYAKNDTFNATSGSTTPLLIINDTINGTPASSMNNNGSSTGSSIEVSSASPNNSPALILNPEGTISVVEGTPTGTYEFHYQICEITDTKSICDTATAYVTVSSTLPVDLLSFNAIHQGASDAMVTWIVAKEENISHYQLQHSTDGVRFIKLYDVKAIDSKDYQYLHHNIPNGANYYRLAVIENGNQLASYSPIAIVNQGAASAINLFPNPTKGMIQVTNIAADMTNKSIVVYDYQGKQVIDLNITGTQVMIDLSTFPQGLYFVAMPDGNNFKVIKE